jgi:hypothetical protein
MKDLLEDLILVILLCHNGLLLFNKQPKLVLAAEEAEEEVTYNQLL